MTSNILFTIFYFPLNFFPSLKGFCKQSKGLKHKNTNKQHHFTCYSYDTAVSEEEDQATQEFLNTVSYLSTYTRFSTVWAHRFPHREIRTTAIDFIETVCPVLSLISQYSLLIHTRAGLLTRLLLHHLY